MLDFLGETIANRINSFTPEEEAAARKEYEWALEGVDEDWITDVIFVLNKTKTKTMTLYYCFVC